MTRRKRWLAVGLWALACGAAAGTVKEGSTLYVRARNTRVLASPTSSQVVAILQPGHPVTWLGKEPGRQGWHRIQADGKKGVVLAANLSVKPVRMELVSSQGKRVADPNAFLQSGAATKALTAGPIAYGEKKDMKQAVHDVTAMEQLSKAVTTADVAAHAREVGLPAVVGPVAEGGGK